MCLHGEKTNSWYCWNKSMTICCNWFLTLESLLSFDMLDEESGLSGGEESTCKGASFLTLISDGVCNGAALEQTRFKDKLLPHFDIRQQGAIYLRSIFIIVLTECFALCSSSCTLQSSCSKELASSLNKPTSSQFFRKRVGVGVWSTKIK